MENDRYTDVIKELSLNFRCAVEGGQAELAFRINKKIDEVIFYHTGIAVTNRDVKGVKNDL